LPFLVVLQGRVAIRIDGQQSERSPRVTTNGPASEIRHSLLLHCPLQPLWVLESGRAGQILESDRHGALLALLTTEVCKTRMMYRLAGQ